MADGSPCHPICTGNIFRSSTLSSWPPTIGRGMPALATCSRFSEQPNFLTTHNSRHLCAHLPIPRCAFLLFHLLYLGFPSVGSLWYSSLVHRPWSPYWRRLWGFGTPTLGRSTHHEEPNQIAVLPYAWTFLDPPAPAACFHVCQSWRSYIFLQIDSCRLSVANLPATCLKPSSLPSPTLSTARAQLYACALLQFHFIYGDFIPWLSGNYTNRHRAWSKDFTTVVQTAKRPLSLEYRVPDYPRAFCNCTEGVPLQGNFTTPAS
jgi:hypothetical protein